MKFIQYCDAWFSEVPRQEENEAHLQNLPIPGAEFSMQGWTKTWLDPSYCAFRMPSHRTTNSESQWGGEFVKNMFFSWCCPFVYIELRCLLVMANDSFFQALCCSDRRVHKINIVNTKCSSRPMPRNVQWKEHMEQCSRPPTCTTVPHSFFSSLLSPHFLWLLIKVNWMMPPGGSIH